MSERKTSCILDTFLSINEDTTAPVSYLTWSALFIISAALERKCWLRIPEGAYVFPNEYMLFIGPPGIRKSSTAKKAIGLLRQLVGPEAMPDKITSAALLKKLEEVCWAKTFEWEGENYQNTSVHWFISEMIVGINRAEKTGDVIEMLTELYECHNADWNNRSNYWSKYTVSGGELRIYNPYITLLACTTVDWLIKGLGQENINSGFASRCLFIYEDEYRNAKSIWSEEHDFAKIETKVIERQIVHDLGEVHKMQGEFQTDAGFRKVYREFDAQNTEFLRHNTTHKFAGYFQRKGWHIMKVAMLLSASESSDMLLKEHHARKAWELVEGLEIGMHKAFKYIKRSDEYEALQVMWDAIKNMKQPFKKSDLQFKLLRTHTQQQIMRQLDQLLEVGKLQVDIPPGKRGLFYTRTSDTLFDEFSEDSSAQKL